MSKSEAHSFYKVTSWMTFTVTHDCPGNSTEQSTHGPLTLLLYDVDRVVEPLQEACLEYLRSNPLGFVPLLDNPRLPIVALALPLLAAEWEKYQEVGKVQHLCHQQ
jgi:hypothetical protein